MCRVNHFSFFEAEYMDTLKSIARRATQTTKEKVGNANATTDPVLKEGMQQIRNYERVTMSIADKVSRLCQVLDDLALILKEIGEDYKKNASSSNLQTPREMVDMTMSLIQFGSEIGVKSDEIKANLKQVCYDPLIAYGKECEGLQKLEDQRRNQQLEYDFFKAKCADLLTKQQKDSTRIPRNEQIREKWRHELYTTTEAMKSSGSSLFNKGVKTVDNALFQVCMSMGKYSALAAKSSQEHFGNSTLPLYDDFIIMPPAPLPLPEFSSNTIGFYGGQANAPHVPAISAPQQTSHRGAQQSIGFGTAGASVNFNGNRSGGFQHTNANQGTAPSPQFSFHNTAPANNAPVVQTNGVTTDPRGQPLPAFLR